MENRHIAPSNLHREIDEKREQLRNSTNLHLNKFKARRKRLSTSESTSTTTSHSKSGLQVEDDVEKEKPRDEIVLNGGSVENLPHIIEQKKIVTNKVFCVNKRISLIITNYHT